MKKTKDKAKLVADSILYTVKSGQKVVVLTGAGILTESGIPDFRSPQGIWSNSLPYLSKKFVIINEEATYFDSMAKVCMHEKTGAALEQIYDYLTDK